MTGLLFLLLILLPSAALAEVREIELQHRAAGEIVEQLRGLLDEGEQIAAAGSTLIIRADGESLTAVEKLVSALDRPPEQLIVRIRHMEHPQRLTPVTESAVRYRTEGSLSVADRNARYLGNSRREYEQTLRLQEGSAAWFEVGKDLPYTQEWAAYSGEIAGFSEKIAYRRISTGFDVAVQQVTGDKVLLAIQPRVMSAEQSGHSAPELNYSRVGSQIYLPFGEWTELAALLAPDDRLGRAVILSNRKETLINTRIFIRIDRVEGFSP